MLFDMEKGSEIVMPSFPNVAYSIYSIEPRAYILGVQV